MKRIKNKMLISELKEEYLEHLKIRNYSENTIFYKKRSIRCLIEYIGDKNIQDILEDDIREYQKYRYYYKNKMGRQDDEDSQNRYIITAKLLFEYAVKQGYINRNPAQNIELIKVGKRLLKGVISDKAVRKILRQTDLNTLIGYRDRTILEVLYSTAIRNSELCNIKLKDVQLEEGIIIIRKGKGNKDRVVPIGKYAKKYLEGYVKFVRGNLLRGKQSEYLFVSKRDEQLMGRGLYTLVLKYKNKAGIETNVTPHTFRRSCATEMIKRKANIMYVSKLLGHEDLESIKPYCNLSIIDLKEAHAKYHPREKADMI